jgi:hypothetical protein
MQAKQMDASRASSLWGVAESEAPGLKILSLASRNTQAAKRHLEDRASV